MEALERSHKLACFGWSLNENSSEIITVEVRYFERVYLVGVRSKAVELPLALVGWFATHLVTAGLRDGVGDAVVGATVQVAITTPHVSTLHHAASQHQHQQQQHR